MAQKDLIISIHVPREGHDYYPSKSFDQVSRISIHVPREGHDTAVKDVVLGAPVFQSTCPARGTTANNNDTQTSAVDFNPRAPRGARPNER